MLAHRWSIAFNSAILRGAGESDQVPVLNGQLRRWEHCISLRRLNRSDGEAEKFYLDLRLRGISVSVRLEANRVFRLVRAVSRGN